MTSRQIAIVAAVAVLGDIVVAVGDVAAKRWTLGHGGHFLIAAAGCYAVTTAFWFVVLKTVGDLGRSTVLWASGGLVVASLIGWLWFREPMTANKVAGVLLSVAGLILCSL